MGREAKAKAARRNPVTKAIERALAKLEIVKQNVELAMRTPAFKESLDTRAQLLVGTPDEITSNEMAAALAAQIVKEQGFDLADLQISTLLRHGRLQIWVEIDMNARARVATQVRERMAAAARAAARAAL